MSVFAQEWRDCLQAQYRHVIQTNDKITERTLVDVLRSVGFTEDDLKAIYLEATMHADHVADDFLPEVEMMEALAADAGQVHHAHNHDHVHEHHDEAPADHVHDEPEAPAPEPEEPPARASDAPEQLSLF